MAYGIKFIDRTEDNDERAAREQRRKRVAIYAAQIAARRVTCRRFSFGPVGNRARPVECIELGKRFATVGEAGRTLSIKPTNISQAIRKGCRAGGLRSRHVPGALAVNISNNRCRPVVCVQTGESFRSLADAARAHNVSISAVFSSAKFARPSMGRDYRYAQTFEPVPVT